MKIFIPNDSTYDECYEVLDGNTIRAYDTFPSINTSYSYRDYFLHSDYIFKDGLGEWTTIDTLPICLDESIITHDIFYRVDLSHIMVIFFVMFFFIFIIPLFVCSKFFYRR